MSEIFNKLSLYLQYPFVQYALVVGVLIALCSSLLGVTLVLKRFSFIGDGLSHVAFGAMAIAAVLQFTNDMPFVLLITIISAVLLLRTGQNAKIKGDASLAMISVGALAIGYLLMNIFSTSSNLSGDVCTTLFGSTSILTLTPGEVWLCIILSLLVIAVFIFFYLIAPHILRFVRGWKSAFAAFVLVFSITYIIRSFYYCTNIRYIQYFFMGVVVYYSRKDQKLMLCTFVFLVITIKTPIFYCYPYRI